MHDDIAVSLHAAQPMPDSLLLRRAPATAQAFAALVRAHQGSVFSIGLRMLNRRDAAEDLAQDVFLQLYRKLDSIESLEHLGFWLRRVASNLAIDWLRRLPYTATQPLDEGAEVAAQQPDDDPLMSRELDAVVRRARAAAARRDAAALPGRSRRRGDRARCSTCP